MNDKRFLANILSNLPGMAYHCQVVQDWTMDFVSAGCVELTGYQTEEIIGNRITSFSKLICAEDRQFVKDQIEQALYEHRQYDITYRIVARDDQEKWVREVGQGVDLQNGKYQALEGFITDISAQTQSELKLHKKMEHFSALRKIDNAIMASFDLNITLKILLEQVIRFLEVDAADILLYNPSYNALEFTVGQGFKTSALRYTRLQFGEGFAGKAAFERRIISVENLAKVPGQFTRSLSLDQEGFVAYYGVPLIAKGQVEGVLEIFVRSPRETDAEWHDFLQALASQAAIAIDNATLFSQLQRSNFELSIAYDATLEGWSRALELRHQETSGHSERVTEHTLQLAQRMGIQGQQLVHIRRGSLLHDIGKMGIPDKILLKPGPLTESEWEIMRRHPEYAYKLLSSVDVLDQALDIPYAHHEKWDGSGYPRGLVGEQIPLSARIFAVVDVWDALSSDRPYRLAWKKPEVLNYLKAQRGFHFDPQVVDNFMGLIAA